jgi:hypothetical protein
MGETATVLAAKKAALSFESPVDWLFVLSIEFKRACEARRYSTLLKNYYRYNSCVITKNNIASDRDVDCDRNVNYDGKVDYDNMSIATKMLITRHLLTATQMSFT